MNKYGYVLLGMLLVFNTGVTLYAQEAEAEVQAGYTETFLKNEYLVESNKFIALAEQAFAEAKYDDAIRYAAEAVKFAGSSDEYVSLQQKIKEVNEAIAATETRMNRAKQTGMAKTYAETFGEAEVAFAEALAARDGGDWDKAQAAVQRTIALLDTFPNEPVYPAQYLVRTRDSLWNIAAKPEIYGDPFQWRHIYNANRDKMPKANDPDLITPGMLLDIPSIKGELRFGVMEE
jgi:nucleoid-associated protein YgaU